MNDVTPNDLTIYALSNASMRYLWGAINVVR